MPLSHRIASAIEMLKNATVDLDNVSPRGIADALIALEHALLLPTTMDLNPIRSDRSALKCDWHVKSTCLSNPSGAIISNMIAFIFLSMCTPVDSMPESRVRIAFSRLFKLEWLDQRRSDWVHRLRKATSMPEVAVALEVTTAHFLKYFLARFRKTP